MAVEGGESIIERVHKQLFHHEAKDSSVLLRGAVSFAAHLPKSFNSRAEQ